MSSSLFKVLFYKYLDETMSPEELIQWHAMLQNEAYTEQLNELLKETVVADHSAYAGGLDASLKDIRDEVFTLIMKNAPQEEKSPVRKIVFLRQWRWAAAVILLVAGVSTYLVVHRTSSLALTTPALPLHPRDILPGKNGALLTLADGRQIALDSTGSGAIAMQDGTKISLAGSQLKYNQPKSTTGAIVWNTLTTPRGRQFTLVLPDASKVWLNAGSSIHYPVTFTGAARQVEITGEAYFEVAKNEKMPFRVKINESTTVEVLGTHFNINAYPDENKITTTLLEGKVAIRNKQLVPGQQALVQANESAILIAKADTIQSVAWKNGFFNFDNMGLQEILLQLSRWYNLQVVYEGKIPDRRFGGEIQRNLPLSRILQILEKMEVKFRVEEGNKLVVIP